LVPDCDYSDWSAIHDSMPGKTPTLRVTATAKCTRGGCEVTLVPQRPGINPRDLILKIEESCPEPATTEMEDVPVSYEDEVDADAYDTVTIVPDGPAGLKIEKVC
jgi:hypothetical protein